MSSWKASLTERLDEELHVLEEEGELAEDSFGSLDVPVGGGRSDSQQSTGHVLKFLSIVTIQSMVRSYLARERVSQLRVLRNQRRHVIGSTTVTDQLVDVYDVALNQQEDVLDDSFASSEDSSQLASLDNEPIEALERAVGTYQVRWNQKPNNLHEKITFHFYQNEVHLKSDTNFSSENTLLPICFFLQT